jgi:hypothetical protein
MTPDDLLHLAGHLVANKALGDAEARLRCAVSRAYYAALHLTINTLEEFSVHIPQNHEGHEQAYRRLFATQLPDAQQAARLLHDLRRDRNEADYRLDRRRFANEANARLAVETASDVRRLLRNCQQEPMRTFLQRHFATQAGA